MKGEGPSHNQWLEWVWQGSQVRNRTFSLLCFLFIIAINLLPRQARDKHKQTSKNHAPFRSRSAPPPSSSPGSWARAGTQGRWRLTRPPTCRTRCHVARSRTIRRATTTTWTKRLITSLTSVCETPVRTNPVCHLLTKTAHLPRQARDRYNKPKVSLSLSLSLDIMNTLGYVRRVSQRWTSRISRSFPSRCGLAAPIFSIRTPTTGSIS